MSNVHKRLSKKSITRPIIGRKIAQKHDISYVSSYKFIGLVIEEISLSLNKGKEVKIPNFGVFFSKEKGERAGRNPKTGERAIVSARRVALLRYSKKLRERIGDKT
jgi:integration host factor subunit alpha